MNHLACTQFFSKSQFYLPLIRTDIRGTRNMFSENFAYVLNGWSWENIADFCFFKVSFHASGFFLNPLKTSENFSFSDDFKGYRKIPVAQNGLVSFSEIILVLWQWKILEWKCSRKCSTCWFVPFSPVVELWWFECKVK